MFIELSDSIRLFVLFFSSTEFPRLAMPFEYDYSLWPQPKDLHAASLNKLK